MRNRKDKKNRSEKANDKKGRKSRSETKTYHIQEVLLDFFRQNPTKAFSINHIIKKLGIKSGKSQDLLSNVVYQLEQQNVLVELENGRFQLSEKPNYMTGIVDHVNPRFAFIISGESETDIRINTENLAGALDGDTVKIAVYPGRGGRPEGEVVEIIQRKRDEFVGKIEILPKYAFVIPDSRKIFSDIYVKQADIKGAQPNDKVIVKITQWPTADRNPEGEVVRVLGKSGEHETEMHSIMAEFGLPFEFPKDVQKEAEAIPETITEEEISQRRDFRDITTFTIDPVDAKDFDDALSIRQLDDDRWEIGVHIADVTHYVHPNSRLEREALGRATSVYLVDRTIPMLPEKLSNALCSLRPHEDKLTFSAVFEMNANGKILNEWYGRTIIHSNRRFTYEEAQERLDAQSGDYSEELNLLNTIAKKLKEQRFKKGAISFETVEVRFKLDEKGVPLAVYPKIRQDAHKLIEEFMLLANRKVAEFVYNLKKGRPKNTMVYRIHDSPDPEKMMNFSKFVRRFGYTLNVDPDKEKKLSSALNNMIDDLEGKPEQNIIQNLAIRTMAKARYSTENIGHFGLAFAYYTHFTSPIRRYPDMMAHRLLQHYLDGGAPANKEASEEKCKHSSDMERIAADAERASIKYKQVEFMQNMDKRVFDGIVTGVTEFGIFVEIIETRCEGMVRMSEMEDDYYELDAENYRVIGKRTKKIISFGDKVQVRVIDTNLDKRSIDLAFAQDRPEKPTKQDMAQLYPKRPIGRTIKKETEEEGFDW